MLLLYLGSCRSLGDGCIRVLFKDATVYDSLAPRSHSLVAICESAPRSLTPASTDTTLIATWFSTEFIVYEYPNERNPPKPAMMGQVNGPPGEIAELTQNRVREATEKRLEAEGRAILAIDVYEVRLSNGPL